MDAVTGIITTVAGNGTSGFSGDGGPATAASIYSPFGVAVDTSGNLYISDFGNYRVRRVDTNGIITTFAGTGVSGYSGDGGPATQAKLGLPFHLALDSKDHLYIADQNSARVRKVTGSPTTTTFPTTAIGQSITQAISVQVNSDTVLRSISLGAGFNTSLMPSFKIGDVTGTGCSVDGTTVTAAGTICTVSVTFQPRFPGHLTAPLTFTDSDGLQTKLELAGDATGSLLAFTPGSSFVIPVNSGGVPLTVPVGMAFSSADKFYIADVLNNRVVVTDSGTAGVVGTGGIPLHQPYGVAVDATDNIYILNSDSSGIVKVDPSGEATSIPVNVAGLAPTSPWGIAVAENGDIYIADTGNRRVLKLNAQGVGTVVSTGAYTLNSPRGLAIDHNGNLFIADISRVLKVAANGVTSVVSTGSITVNITAAITVDPVGNLYILDANGKVVEVATDGTVFPIAVGSLPLASSYGIVFRKGYLFISDTDTNIVGNISLTNPQPLTFSDTLVGHTSSDGTKMVSVQNIGNQILTFATPGAGSNPSYPDNFPQDGNGLQLCGAGTTLNPGSYCNLAVTFKPTMAGSNSGSVALTDDMLNAPGSTQSVALSGTGVATLDHFTVTGAPTTSDAGTAFDVTVTAVDSNGATVTNYTGAVHFDTSDTLAGLPADYTFVTRDNGVHTFQVTLKTAGSQTITVYDTGNSALTGDAVVQVNAATPTEFTISGGQGQSVTIGKLFSQSLDVLLKDQYGNPVPNVSVTFTSPSSGAGLYISSTMRTSDYTGKASLYTLANGFAGSYQVVATAEGVSTPVTFNLTNTAGMTTTALTATPSTGVTYGQSITLTATVTTQGAYNPTIAGSSGPQPRMAGSVQVGPATGVVSFYDGTRLVGTANLGGDAVVVGNSRGGVVAHIPISNQATTATGSVSISAPVGGDHNYTAVYAGDTNFGGSQTTAAVAVTVGATAATLTGPATQPVTVANGQSASITVTVAAQSGAAGLVAPTGTISYQIGTNGMQVAQVTDGQATLQVPNTLAVGSYSIQATYSGDSNYQAVVTPITIQLSVISTVAPDFTLTANPTSLTLRRGETGFATFTLTPVGGFKGTITLSCGTLPAGVTCTFNPASLTADGSNTVLTSQLTVTTQKLTAANLYLPGAMLGLLLFWQRRRFNLRKAQVLMLVLGAAVIAGMAGCGSSATQQNTTSSSVTVTATATAGGGATSHTATFNLNITD